MPSKKKQIQQEKSYGKKSRDNSKPSETSLKGFFSQYPQFKYDPTSSASLEFYRLCKELGWGKRSRKKRDARQKFKDALVHEFNRFYGTDPDNLQNWQKLCSAVHVDPIPDDLYACQEAVHWTYVNLVDLVDVRTSSKAIELFETEVELSKYTKGTGKIFPSDEAHAGGLLRKLLRHIYHPWTEERRREKWNSVSVVHLEHAAKLNSTLSNAA